MPVTDARVPGPDGIFDRPAMVNDREVEHGLRVMRVSYMCSFWYRAYLRVACMCRNRCMLQITVLRPSVTSKLYENIHINNV